MGLVLCKALHVHFLLEPSDNRMIMPILQVRKKDSEKREVNRPRSHSEEVEEMAFKPSPTCHIRPLRSSRKSRSL